MLANAGKTFLHGIVISVTIFANFALSYIILNIIYVSIEIDS